METVNVTIITPVAGYVKSGEKKMHVRQHHTDPDIQEISPEIRARSRHVLRCVRKRKSVRVPAMRSTEWGKFLRSLEIHRAVA